MLSARYEDKGRSGGTAPHNLFSELDEGEWLAFCFIRKEKAPGPHCVGGKVGPTANLDSLEKRYISCLCREMNYKFSGVQSSVWL